MEPAEGRQGADEAWPHRLHHAHGGLASASPRLPQAAGGHLVAGLSRPASMVTLADSPSLSMVPSRPTSAHLYGPTAPPGVSLVAFSRTSLGADWGREGEISRERQRVLARERGARRGLAEAAAGPAVVPERGAR